MRQLAFLLSMVFLMPSGAYAKPTKAECKAHAESVTELAKEIGLRPGIRGSALLNAVATWAEKHDEATIREVMARIEEITAGVKECDAGGQSSVIITIKANSTKLETTVLPWLESEAAPDVCQGLINRAVRKQEEDPEGAIADLERSVSECRDEAFLPEARISLVALYYARSGLDENDYRMALDHTRKALQLAEGLEEEPRALYLASLAKLTIEAGQSLMEQKAYDRAKSHWKAYVEIFGTSSFDVLFRVEQVAQTARLLRDLRNANYQISLCCVANGEIDCVRETILPFVKQYEDDSRPIRDLTTTAFELAANQTGATREKSYLLAFDLLTGLRDIDPSSYQISRVIENSLVALERDERLELLRLTDKCWIPMRVAETLRQEDEDYIAEVEVAAACDASAPEAQEMLANFRLQAAHDKLEGLRALSTREQLALLKEVEEQMLPKIGDAAGADEVRAKIAAERSRLQEGAARAARERTEVFDGCTQLLATIQWMRAREEDYDGELRDFERGCCQPLLANATGWTDWMRSRPESERLADEEIENKNKLMKRYCAP